MWSWLYWKKELTPEDKDRHFLHEECHKTYVITTPGYDFIKVGYTKRTLFHGVWERYRPAYGNDLIIVRVYKASEFKEDEKIHKKFHGDYGSKEKGREIYFKNKLAEFLIELDKWHNSKGVGPFNKNDIKHYNKRLREDKKLNKNEEVIISKMSFLKI